MVGAARAAKPGGEETSPNLRGPGPMAQCAPCRSLPRRSTPASSPPSAGRPPADARHWPLGRLPVGGGRRRAACRRPCRPPADEQPPRAGEARPACGACAGFDPAHVVWEDERWVLTHDGAPSGLPLVLVLHTREHVDLGELDDELASELGRISVGWPGSWRTCRTSAGCTLTAGATAPRTSTCGSSPARRGWPRSSARTPSSGTRCCRPARGRLARGPAHRRDQAGQLGRARPGLTESAQMYPVPPSRRRCTPHPAELAQMYPHTPPSRRRCPRTSGRAGAAHLRRLGTPRLSVTRLTYISSGRDRVGGPVTRPDQPDFLLIGAPKAGTTALHAALAQHPDVLRASPEGAEVLALRRRAAAGLARARATRTRSRSGSGAADDYERLFAARPRRPGCAARARRSTSGAAARTAGSPRRCPTSA